MGEGQGEGENTSAENFPGGLDESEDFPPHSQSLPSWERGLGFLPYEMMVKGNL